MPLRCPSAPPKSAVSSSPRSPMPPPYPFPHPSSPTSAPTPSTPPNPPSKVTLMALSMRLWGYGKGLRGADCGILRRRPLGLKSRHLWRGEYKATDEFMPSAQRSVLYVDDQLSIDAAAVGQSFEWMDWPLVCLGLCGEEAGSLDSKQGRRWLSSGPKVT